MKNKTTVVVIMLALWLLPINVGATQNSLLKRIQFLDSIQKVQWYKIEGRKVIIGWKGIPDNFYGLNYKAALNASKSSLYEVQVWSVRYPRKDWSPGDGGQVCITTAKKGRVGKCSCKNNNKYSHSKANSVLSSRVNELDHALFRYVMFGKDPPSRQRGFP